MGIRKTWSKASRVSALVLCACLAASATGMSVLADDVVADPALAGLAPISQTALYLRAGTIDTTAGRPGVADMAGQPGRFVIQLDGPMTPAWRAALLGAGVQLGDYLPMNAWIVRLENADPTLLGAMGFVRWWAPFDNAWKLAPEVGSREFTTLERQVLAGQGRSLLLVELFIDADLHSTVQAVDAIQGVSVSFVDWIGTHAALHVEAPTMAAATIAAVPGVQFIEDFPEITLRNNTTRWILQTNVNGNLKLYNNGLTGEGQVVGIIDDKINVNHCSFSDTNPIGPLHRKILAYNTSLGSQFHGTHVAGTAAGDAGANNDNRGMAYLAKIVYNTIPSFSETAIFQRLEQHHSQGGREHTNSWGNDGTTAYDGLCRGFDRFQHTYEESQTYLAVTNGSNLRNPENAKNLLAVGASQDTPNQDQHCSGGQGPTSDGRRKPEIYAPGCNTNSSWNSSSCSTTAATGTSMASPAIAGMGSLVRQYYTDGYYPTGAPKPTDAFTPSGALVKATLINGAVDMTGIAGYPSNREGWGRLLADVSLYFPGDTRTTVVRDVWNASGLSTGQTETVQFNVVGSAEQLRVTLVFTDVAANAGASFAPVNDLDLEVVAPGGVIYKGNQFSDGVSVPGGSKDDRNNVEQVHVNTPPIGVWTARVIGAGVQQGKQGYALVATGQVAQELPLQVYLAAPAPESLTPLTPYNVDAMIVPGTDTLIAGSPTLHYRTGAIGAFTSVQMTHQGGDLYRAPLPGFSCGEIAEFYVSAQSVESGTVTAPALSTYAPYQSIVGPIVLLALDYFEIDSGWTSGASGDTATAGVWNRMAPQETVHNGFVVQPGSNHTPGGLACWVTDGVAGANANARDVDGGHTTLVSPSFSTSAYRHAMLAYWRWYTNSRGNNPNQDTFRVSLSADGLNWSLAETVGPGGPIADGGWYRQMISTRGHTPASSNVRIRFVAEDLAPDSLVEALVDDFELYGFDCPPDSCPADFNGDTVVNSLDVLAFLNAYTAGHSSADFNGDTVINTLDVLAFLNAYTAGCD
ncbi:MAG: S8 family serine peptidase [Phycisphaeraceae bacterium]|nr:S8 family serine peptidase [Phycisphaeraceae bacterium]